MTSSTAFPLIRVDAGAVCAEEAIAVMHRAFAQYARKGKPSGAMLETAASLRAELRGGARLAVAGVDGRLAAMAKHREAGDATLYFSRLAVDPQMRGRGLARALLGRLRTAALNAGLQGLSCRVRADEAGNIALYRHLGLEIVGRGSVRSLTGRVQPVVVMRDVGSVPVE
jgi:ribosomal protein S18 acetylase RimI-like enzyme